jgi:hypothetical protein
MRALGQLSWVAMVENGLLTRTPPLRCVAGMNAGEAAKAREYRRAGRRTTSCTRAAIAYACGRCRRKGIVRLS